MASRPDLEESEEFWSDLKNPDLSKRFIMERWNCSSSFVVDRRRAIGFKKAVVTSTAPATSKSAGESEQHNPDGSSSYTRYSERPWGEEDFRKFLLERGTDPNSVTFTFGWTSNPAGGFWNKLNNVRKKPEAASTATFPLSHMYAEAKKLRARMHDGEGADSSRSTVIVISDWQVAKRGRRGGTPELLARLNEARSKVYDELLRRRPSQILLLDGGDGIEGFESGGNPMFTNDLSLPDMLDCYATELTKFVRLAHEFAPLQVGIVPSNHSAWRRGKQNLGNPSDDFGIFTHKQVAKVAEAAGLNAEWHYPDEYDESLCVDFAGTPIGLVHGNQFAPGKAIDWWSQQAFGSQAITRADVMVHGHYHAFEAGVAGQNPFTGRERMMLGAPTLDSGSDWYRNIKGRDSLPGTMVFDVISAGFDLSSLTIV